MRRLILGFVLAIGMLMASITSASAHTFCSVDPAVGVGLPVHGTVSLLGSTVYVTGNSSSTDVGAVLGLP